MQKLIIAALLAVSCFCQTATIYELPPEDTKQGRALYEELEAAKDELEKATSVAQKKVDKAQRAYEAWDKREARKLRGVDPAAKDNANLPGLSYSADFHLAVPAPANAVMGTITGSGLTINGSTACLGQNGIIVKCF